MTVLPPETAAHDATAAVPPGFPAWAIGLILLMAMVVSANGILLWLSAKGHRDLVRKDYYESGLDEDRTIARNALARSAGRVELLRTPAGWRVETEADMPGAGTLKAHFYRPDDGREDRIVAMSRPAAATVGGRGLWEGPGSGLRRGRWLVNLVWEDKGAPLSETTVIYQAQ